MYIETVPNRNSPPAILLREGWREGRRVCKKTLANLTHWPTHKIDALRRVLKDEPRLSPGEVFRIERSLPHGHVEAILQMIERIGLDRLIGSHRTRNRDLVLAMMVERLIRPCSKLATTRLWHTTTLADCLSVADAREDELYAAMDWLLARQSRIENKLAARHLVEGGQVLYDVSSSYYEGHSCPLARFGHSRDGKRGKPIVVYGVLTDRSGRPVAVDVYPGNTADPTTGSGQQTEAAFRFGASNPGGRPRHAHADANRDTQAISGEAGWISALRTGKLRQLVEQQSLQLSLFDQRNLAEIHSPDFPGERLIVCFNPMLAEQRHRKRQELLQATEKALDKLVKQVERRTKTPPVPPRSVARWVRSSNASKLPSTSRPSSRTAISLINGAPKRSNAKHNGRRDLCDSYQRTGIQPFRRRYGTQL